MALFAASLSLLAVPVIASPSARERTTTIGDRSYVNLTVYNQGIALVHDRRRITLPAGASRLSWRDVSAGIDATSVLFDTKAGPLARVDEQNYNFDVLNPQALMERYLGKEVIVVHDPEVAGERPTRERANILSLSGGIVLQYRDRIETSVRGHILFPNAAGTVRDRPTLDLQVESPGGTSLVDLSYTTSGLGWNADYVGLMSRDERTLQLTGLVTLTNTSGTSFENAHLQLVAGNVNVAAAAKGTVQPGTIANVYGVKAIAREENYFEYHLYTFPGTTSILNQQTKQVTLLNARDIPIRKSLELRGGDSYYESSVPDLGDRLPLQVYVSFLNSGGGLGVPLPAGTVRMYENDSHGISQLAGSDSIGHTPKNETVRLYLGQSFDVTARKKQTGYRGLGDCQSESEYRIELKNAKSVPEQVEVVEPIPGEWRITQESYPHEKSSSSTATWHIDVPAESASILTYSARVKWCS